MLLNLERIRMMIMIIVVRMRIIFLQNRTPAKNFITREHVTLFVLKHIYFSVIIKAFAHSNRHICTAIIIIRCG